MADQIVWYDSGGFPHFIPVSYDPLTRPTLDRPIVPGPTSQPVPVVSAPPQVAPSTPPMAPAPSPIDPSEFAAILYDKSIPIGLSTRAQWGGRIIEGPTFGSIGGENVASFIVGFYVPVNYWDTTRTVTELYFRGQLAWTASSGALMSGLNVGVATSGGAQTARFNTGTLTQVADAWSVGRFGIDLAPAYVPMVTAVVENIRLAQFGNLVPFVSVTVEDSAFGAPGDLTAWADAIEALARYDGRDADEFETVDVSGGLMALVLGSKITFTDFLSGMRHHKPQWNIRTADKLYLVEKGLFSLDVTLQRERLLRKGAQPITIHSSDAFDAPREKVAKFLDYDRDYEPSNVKVSEDIDPIIETDSYNTDTYDVPIASVPSVMMAETSFAFYTEQAARDKSEWSGMAHMIGLDVGDCYRWTSGGRDIYHRVNEIVRKPDFTLDVKGEGFLTCIIEEEPLSLGLMALGNWRDATLARHVMPAMSLDGVNWTTAYPEDGGLYYGASNGSRVVVFGWRGATSFFDVFWHSDDQGRTWTSVDVPNGPDDTMVGQLFDAIWDGTQFIFVGNDGSNRPIAMRSPDGVTWTTHFVDSNNDPGGDYAEVDLYGVAYGNGVYVAVGTSFMDDEEAILYRSTDAITWVKHVITVPPISSEFEDVVWNGSLFVAVGYDAEGDENALVMTSPNGLTWTKRTVPVDVDGQFYGIGCKPDGMCVAVGERWMSNVPCVAVSPDGVTWTAVDIPTLSTHDVATCYNVAWNGSLWCAVGQQTISLNMAYIMTSPDGVAWTIQQVIGNQIDTFLDDVIATPVNPVTVDLSHRTDVFSMSVWIKGADDGQLWGTAWPGEKASNVQSTTNGQFHTRIRSADFSELVVFGLIGTGTLIDPTIWSHVLLSIDTNHPTGTKIFQLWVNDVDVIANGHSAPPEDNSPAFQMKWHGNPFAMNGSATYGSPTTPNFPNAKFDIAEAWFAPGQYIDFSVMANRRKFISAGGTPVGLGSDGSLPTGVAPAVYFSGNATAFPTNKGTGGAFTKSGTITDAPTSPSGVAAVRFVSGSCLLNPSLNAP